MERAPELRTLAKPSGKVGDTAHPSAASKLAHLYQASRRAIEISKGLGRH